MTKLTLRSVEAARVEDREYIIWDDELPGFGLRVFVSGKRSYIIQYRAKGRTRRYTIGSHGVWTPETARREAKVQLGLVAKGENPAEDRKINHKAITVKELCKLYIKDMDAGLILGKGGRPKKASTIAIDKGRILRHIIPLLGTRRVQDLTRAEMIKVMNDITAGRTRAIIKTKKLRGKAVVRGGPGAARRTIGFLGGILTYAVNAGIIERNPVHGIQRPKGKARTRRLSEAEYRTLGAMLAEAEKDEDNAVSRVDLTDGRALLLYPTDRLAWSQLTRLLSIGKARGGKARCILDWSDIAARAEGLIAILVPDLPDAICAGHLADLAAVFGVRAYLALSYRRRPDDVERLHALDRLARAARVRAVATGDILYHSPDGRTRSALTAVVTRYRTRGAVAEVGKALGLPRDLTKMLTGLVWGWSMDGISDEQIASLNLNSNDHRLKLTLRLARQLIGTPRHLSQHPGGFVLTQDRLDDLVPIEPARMEDRQIIEWDKDDIDALRFMKVDVLGLGMLGCMNRAFNLLEEHKGVRVEMADLQDDDPEVYKMIQKADTLGVFQIESRAQMSMLPRMKPTRFYDLVIEVAIVRPGPIQGDMVHPYLRRREGKEKPEYPKPELRAVLEKTLGVPLFQEQAMKVAIVGAGFTAAEADQLRRAMATFKLTGGVSHFYDKLVGGMVARGYPQDFAERTFKQIEGFGSYGFPESHAASFAKIAYASCWMKHHHPDVFCAALLNAQPMGFYAPAQIVQDAQRHGVEVRPVSINHSHWDCTLEPSAGRHLAVRLGFRQVRSLANVHGAAIAVARGEVPYESVEEVWRRAGVPRAAIERLAEADAFHCIAEDRRQGLWKVKGLGEAPLPLFAGADAREGGFSPEGLEPRVTLQPLTDGREVVEDYRSLQLSLRAHPLTFLREQLAAEKIVRCGELAGIRDGRFVEVAGVILVRQRPGSARGVLFITIEDETGVANGILWPDRFEKQRRVVMSASMVSLRGRLQKEGHVIHVIVDRVIPRDDMLRSIGRMDMPVTFGRGDGATHAGAPDRGDPGWRPGPRDLYSPPFQNGVDPEDMIKVRSHDFH